MRQTFRLKRIDPASAGKLSGAIQGAVGLVVASFVLLAKALGMTKAATESDVPVGVVAVILIPIISGLMGLLTGWIIAVFFNFFSGMVGGIALTGDVEPGT